MDSTHTSHSPSARRRGGHFANFLVASLLMLAAPPALADVRSNDANSIAASSITPALKPGEFQWTPERAPPGQVVVLVSLPEQLAHAYRNGVRIGISTVSTGKPSHPTPTGSFEILQKKRMNYSNLYNNAPMPFMQRLTWDGIALHAGNIPGSPASHGCVRLPLAFAEKLYAETQRGMLVVIADETSHDLAVVHPGDRAPIDAYSGLPINPASELDAIRTVAAAP